jgi:hypothetical protein
MLITVIHVDVSDAGTGRNKYQIAEVTYETSGNKRAFKIFSFVNPQVFKVISTAKSGDQFNVTVGKNDKGYDAWNAIDAASAQSANSPTSAPSTASAPKYVGDRESKDEREAKQRFIIRQSSLSNAVAVLTVGAKSAPKTAEVLTLAEEFVKYVYGGATTADAIDLFNQPSDLEDVPY